MKIKNYKSFLENELPKIIEKDIIKPCSFESEHDWIIAGGSIANTAINYLFNENVAINNIDIYVFNNRGENILDSFMSNTGYTEQSIFEYMNFAVGPVIINDPYEIIPVRFSLLDKVNFDDVIVPYFLNTFPLNCTKIAYNPKTHRIVYTKAFLEFLQHRRILFNPIYKDVQTSLFRGLKKHQQGVGKLSSNYVRRIFNGMAITVPDKKYLDMFEKLKTYPFIYMPPNASYLQIDPLPGHELLCDDVHTIVAFENERIFYNAETIEQAMEIAKQENIFYIISTIVEPEFLRRKILVIQKSKILGYKHGMDYLLAECILAPKMIDILSLIDGLFNNHIRYTLDEVVPLLITHICYGIRAIFRQANKSWHNPVTPLRFKFQIKNKAELSKFTNSRWKFSRLTIHTKNIYLINDICFELERGRRENANTVTIKDAYKANPALYTFIKIMDSKF